MDVGPLLTSSDLRAPTPLAFHAWSSAGRGVPGLGGDAAPRLREGTGSPDLAL
jgi:hypothetical protein